MLEINKANTKILVVEDEESVSDILHNLLKEERYEVAVAKDGRDGWERFFSWRPNLVILDILMPEIDGWELLARIREISDAPVIMLTALGEENQVVRGLRSGADDYIAKPVRMAELLARVQACLRKSDTPHVPQDEYKDSVLHMDFQRHLVYVRGNKVELTAKEFRLLSALVLNAGNVLSNDRLLDICWGESGGGPENLRVYIGYLRKRLGDQENTPPLIQTVREFGYLYHPPIGITVTTTILKKQ